MAPLTADELKQHPEFPHVYWDLPPAEIGLAPVGKKWGGPIDISYEVHGSGATSLVWIMGLGGLKGAWQRQTQFFAHTEPNSTKYRSLVFDNRGVGKSSKPTSRYSTTEMARDVLDLLEHLKWTTSPPRRTLNIIGVSMGGMIAQELALLIPDQISSLILVSTAARIKNTVGFTENLRQRMSLLVPKEINQQLADIKLRLFSPEFLDQPDEDGGKFPTNGDRFAAQELFKRMDTKSFTAKGFLLQLVAAGWHNKSATQLARLAEVVGPERICIMHGIEDKMITYPHGEVLARELGKGSRFESFEGLGHVLPWEAKRRFNNTVVEMVEKGETLNK